MKKMSQKLVYKVEIKLFCTTNYLEKSEKNGHDLDIFSIKVKLDPFCNSLCVAWVVVGWGWKFFFLQKGA